MLPAAIAENITLANMNREFMYAYQDVDFGKNT